MKPFKMQFRKFRTSVLLWV